MSREAFEEWARSEGLVTERYGVMSINSQCDAAKKAWQAARAAALEEAAEACESEAENWLGEQSVIDFRLCAARIRALKERE